ncbi:MAG: hypothetical protein ACLSBB_15370 [Ruthenibacterium lactatiformans]
MSFFKHWFNHATVEYVFRVLKVAAEEGYLDTEAILWMEPTLKRMPI